MAKSGPASAAEVKAGFLSSAAKRPPGQTVPRTRHRIKVNRIGGLFLVGMAGHRPAPRLAAKTIQVLLAADEDLSIADCGRCDRHIVELVLDQFIESRRG